jgi:hypothetical protein
MTRYRQYHLANVDFNSKEEEIKALTFTLNNLCEAYITTNNGYDFRDQFNDLFDRRVKLMGFDDEIFFKISC